MSTMSQTARTNYLEGTWVHVFCIFALNLYLYLAQYLRVLQDSRCYTTHLTVHKYSPTLKLLTFP